MEQVSHYSDKYLNMAFAAALLVGLYLSSLYNYLLFHSLAELFSIVVISAMFLIAWNSRKYIESHYLMFIAIAYLFIGGLDLLHTLSYKGMAIFTDYDFYANQLWIGARYMESLTLLAAFVFFHTRKSLKPQTIFLLYALVSFLLVSSIFYWKVFPVCFIEGQGLTSFKKISEYIICAILGVDIWLLTIHREHFEPDVFRALIWSLVCTIISELAFTFYISNYGFSNLVGHYFKIFSFYLIYKAIIETGIVRPYDLIFRELVLKEKNLKEAKEAADEANKAKSDFLSNMTHELRTPLNGILGYTQILKRDRSLGAKQQEYVETIHRSGEHLLTLIHDILDLSKIEARKIEFDSVSFRMSIFLKTIADMIRVRAQQKGLELVCDTSADLPQNIQTDEKRLRQILLNLLGNAVKFTEKGQVTFRVKRVSRHQSSEADPQESTETYVPDAENRLLDTENAVLLFEVRDTGIGIPEDRIQRIFEPFQQVGGQRFQIEGTGLGLAISARILLALGSQLHVHSTPGKGSTFWFELEVREVDRVVPREEQSPPVITGFQGEPQKILIVDDHEENRVILREMLRSVGFETIEARNGREAFTQAREYRPHLFLMDLSMPVMDGYEAMRQFRTLDEFDDIPAIAVSASAFEDVRQKSLEAGFQDFLAKPLVVETVLDTIGIYLDIQWQYAQEEEAGESVSAELILPPENDMRTLFQAARIGDIMEIHGQLDRLEQMDTAFLPFVKKMRALADVFQIHDIRQFLEPYVS